MKQMARRMASLRSVLPGYDNDAGNISVMYELD